MNYMQRTYTREQTSSGTTYINKPCRLILDDSNDVGLTSALIAELGSSNPYAITLSNEPKYVGKGLFARIPPPIHIRSLIMKLTVDGRTSPATILSRAYSMMNEYYQSIFNTLNARKDYGVYTSLLPFRELLSCETLTPYQLKHITFNSIEEARQFTQSGALNSDKSISLPIPSLDDPAISQAGLHYTLKYSRELPRSGLWICNGVMHGAYHYRTFESQLQLAVYLVSRTMRAWLAYAELAKNGYSYRYAPITATMSVDTANIEIPVGGITYVKLGQLNFAACVPPQDFALQEPTLTRREFITRFTPPQTYLPELQRTRMIAENCIMPPTFDDQLITISISDGVAGYVPSPEGAISAPSIVVQYPFSTQALEDYHSRPLPNGSLRLKRRVIGDFNTLGAPSHSLLQAAEPQDDWGQNDAQIYNDMSVMIEYLSEFQPSKIVIPKDAFYQCSATWLGPNIEGHALTRTRDVVQVILRAYAHEEYIINGDRVVFVDSRPGVITISKHTLETISSIATALTARTPLEGDERPSLAAVMEKIISFRLCGSQLEEANRLLNRIHGWTSKLSSTVPLLSGKQTSLELSPIQGNADFTVIMPDVTHLATTYNNVRANINDQIASTKYAVSTSTTVIVAFTFINQDVYNALTEMFNEYPNVTISMINPMSVSNQPSPVICINRAIARVADEDYIDMNQLTTYNTVSYGVMRPRTFDFPRKSHRTSGFDGTGEIVGEIVDIRDVQSSISKALRVSSGVSYTQNGDACTVFGISSLNRRALCNYIMPARVNLPILNPKSVTTSDVIAPYIPLSTLYSYAVAEAISTYLQHVPYAPAELLEVGAKSFRMAPVADILKVPYTCVDPTFVEYDFNNADEEKPLNIIQARIEDVDDEFEQPLLVIASFVVQSNENQLEQLQTIIAWCEEHRPCRLIYNYYSSPSDDPNIMSLAASDVIFADPDEMGVPTRGTFRGYSPVTLLRNNTAPGEQIHVTALNVVAAAINNGFSLPSNMANLYLYNSFVPCKVVDYPTLPPPEE